FLPPAYTLFPYTTLFRSSANCLLTQIDEAVVAMTTAYCCVLALLVQGEKLDAAISDKLMDLVKEGALPFHAVTGERLGPPTPGGDRKSTRLNSSHVKISY